MRKGSSGDEKVASVGDGIDAVRGNVLHQNQRQQLEPDEKKKQTHIALLTEMTLLTVREDQLSMKMVQQPLDPTNPRLHPSSLVLPLLAHDVQQLGIQVVETSIRPDGRSRERDEGAGRKGVLRRAFRRGRLVVVCTVHKEGVRRRTGEGDNLARAGATLEGHG
jgi:hypothetical protein